VEYRGITHDVADVERALDLSGAQCANISVREDGEEEEGKEATTRQLQDGASTHESSAADENHTSVEKVPRTYSLTADAATSDAAFRRLAELGANVVERPEQPVEGRQPIRALNKDNTRRLLVPAAELPVHFDARDAWPQCKSIRSIRDQGSKCGSCWAHGAIEALADRTCIQNPSSNSSNLSLSVQYVLDCDAKDSACLGGYIDLVWEFLKADGSPRDMCLPYTASQQACDKRCVDGAAITDQAKVFAASAYPVADRLGDAAVAMQRELVTFGPFETLFWVFNDFSQYHNGTYVKSSGASMMGGHAVKIVGYGVDENQIPYWMVANSYGKGWGLDGFFRIKRGSNECGIETVPTAGAPRGI